MPKPIKLYVQYVSAINKVAGVFAMYLIFVMMGILLLASISRTFFDTPLSWTMEMAQFTMSSYYLIGGGFSLLIGSHVRMDVFYGEWSAKRKAITDAFTSVCLVFYLGVLLAGGISSTQYTIMYNQHSYSAWEPPLAPIKLIMLIGITLMLLQSIASFFQDIAAIRGEKI
ncbi:MAG: TRAP-type C4-dicarboxylate transport system permease small subunit [Desulforhopalus sp.]